MGAVLLLKLVLDDRQSRRVFTVQPALGGATTGSGQLGLDAFRSKGPQVVTILIQHGERPDRVEDRPVARHDVLGHGEQLAQPLEGGKVGVPPILVAARWTRTGRAAIIESWLLTSGRVRSRRRSSVGISTFER